MADGCLLEEERQKIQQLVSRELAIKEHGHDSSGMNQAFYVDFKFVDLFEHHASCEKPVERFNNFLKENLEPGDEALVEHRLNG